MFFILQFYSIVLQFQYKNIALQITTKRIGQTDIIRRSISWGQLFMDWYLSYYYMQYLTIPETVELL